MFKPSVNGWRKFATVVLFALSFTRSYAGKEIYTDLIRGGDVVVGATLHHADDRYFYMATHPTVWPDAFTNYRVVNKVVLELDRTNTSFVSSPFTSTVNVTITYYDEDMVVHTTTQNLVVNYDNNTANDITDLDIYSFTGGHNVKVKVNSISSNPGFLLLRSTIEVERYYAFDETVTPTGLMAVKNAGTDNEIEIAWPEMSGAEEYDLEWVYVNNYDSTGTAVSASLLEVDFKHNSTRITTPWNYWRITPVFERGYIVYRVRGVGKFGTGFKRKKLGTWSDGDAGTVASYADKYTISSPHEGDVMNWAYQAAYTEDGKKFETVQYMDGLGYNRQTIGKNYTENLAMIQENYYDHQGRVGVAALPVPDGESHFNHRTAFNRAASDTTKEYSRLDFDLDDGVNCITVTDSMSQYHGSGQYYSPENPDQGFQQAYVAHAHGYPFIRFEYMNDLTGRLSARGAAGEDHQPGSNHEAKFEYAVADQNVLDQLFGTDAGYNNNYQRRTVTDANGQRLVGYTNGMGQTIATALAGEAPANLDTLLSYTGPVANTVTILDSNLVQYMDSLQGSLLFTYNFSVDVPGVYAFEYGLSSAAYHNDCFPQETVCLDCVYDLDIYLVNTLCGDTLLEMHDTINGSSINATCADTTNYAIVSSNLDANLGTGAYQLTKILTVNSAALDYYTTLYLEQDTCLLTYDDFFAEAIDSTALQNCELGLCGLYCIAQLGTREAYIANGGTGGAYDALLAACIQDCEDSIPNPCDVKRQAMLADFYPGGQYATYAFDTATGVFSSTEELSVFTSSNSLPNGSAFWRTPASAYLDADGNASYLVNTSGDSVVPGHASISLTEFINQFRPSWAKSLLPYHPEYCYLNYCDENLASQYYDAYMLHTTTFAAAVDSGFINPLDMGTGEGLPNGAWNNDGNIDPYFDGSGLMAGFKNKLGEYMTFDTTPLSIWELAYVSTYCNGDTTNAGLASCLGGADFLSDTCKADRFWAIFRALYLNAKQRVYDSAQANYAIVNKCYSGCFGNESFSEADHSFDCYPVLMSPTCSQNTRYNADEDEEQPCSDATRELYAGKVPRFPDASVLDDPTEMSHADFYTDLLDEMNDTLIAECNAACEAYAESWMVQLSGCGLNNTDSTNIRAELIELCKLGCDETHPYGASSLPNPLVTANGNASFDEVLEYHLGASYPGEFCSHLYIHVPEPYENTDPVLDLVTIDTCACDKILGVRKRFYSGQPLPYGVSSLEDLFAQMYGYPMGNIKELSCTCLDAWHTDDAGEYSSAEHWGSGAVTYLAGLSPAVQVPAAITCPTCISCATLETQMEAFAVVYPGVTDADSVYPVLLTAFLNQALNFELTYSQYINFYAHCQEESPVVCSLSTEMHELEHVLNELLDHGVFLTPDGSTSNLSTYTSYAGTSLAGYVGGNNYTTNYPVNGGDPERDPITLYLGNESPCTVALTLDGDTNVVQWDNLVRVNEIRYNNAACGTIHDFYVVGTFNVLGVELTDTLFGTSSCYPAASCVCANLELCNEITYPEPVINDCVQAVLDMAHTQASEAYAHYIAGVTEAFRENYKTHCLREAQRTETMQRVKFDFEYHYTLYYYDQAGNLVQTVAPMGVDGSFDPSSVPGHRSSGSDDVPSHTYVSQYRYNSFNNVTETSSPDGGLTKFYYDYAGRIALSQNAKQVLNDEYSYTRYDVFGRPFEAGQLSGATPATITGTILKNPSNLNSWIVGATRVQVNKTFYDESLNAGIVAQFAHGQNHLRDRVSTVAYYESWGGDDDDYDHASHFSYDLHGNVEEMHQEYPALQYMDQDVKKMQYRYDLVSGNVHEVDYQYDPATGTGEGDQFIHQYYYDNDNRLSEVKTSRNGLEYDQDAKYLYYQHGALARTERGEYKVQAEDYAYTINGWMKGMNAATLNVDRDMGHDGRIPVSGTQLHQRVGRDKLGFTLGYYQDDYEAISEPAMADEIEIDYGSGSAFATTVRDLYNGNITSAVYSIGGLNLQGYQYRYDQLQRLTLSVTQRNPNTSTNSWSGGNAAFAQSSGYWYDANGNLTNLARYGNSSTVMDSLTYKYNGTNNQLQFVNDNVSSGTFSVDVDDQSAGNYAYTEIGELKQDNANGITDIEWRVDGKIRKIERSGNRNQVEYVYDAFGRRVLKLVKPTTSGVPNASSTWTYTYYVNDAQGNIVATYVMTEGAGVQTYKLKEEYIYGASMLGNVDADVTLATYNTSSTVLTESTPDVSKRVLGEKEYLLQNHVMSNMVVVSDRFVPHNNSGTIDYYTAQVVSESDYYPFGMLMLGRNNNATNYRNGFQNQQNDDEIFNTAGSLTTAEFWEYDTRLGRRWNVDPVTYPWQSTYAAFNNNPVVYTDPLGLEGMGPLEAPLDIPDLSTGASSGGGFNLQSILPVGLNLLINSVGVINNLNNVQGPTKMNLHLGRSGNRLTGGDDGTGGGETGRPVRQPTGDNEYIYNLMKLRYKSDQALWNDFMHPNNLLFNQYYPGGDELRGDATRVWDQFGTKKGGQISGLTDVENTVRESRPYQRLRNSVLDEFTSQIQTYKGDYNKVNLNELFTSPDLTNVSNPLRALIGGTQEVDVYLTSMEEKAGILKIDLRIEIWDTFGLDGGEVHGLGFSGGLGNVPLGLAALWVLQWQRGFAPVQINLNFTETITIDLNH